MSRGHTSCEATTHRQFPLPPPAARPADASGPSLVAPAPAASTNTILVVVNLDPRYEQSGWIDLDLKLLGIAHDETFDVEDLLTGIHYQWHDRSNFVALSPTATAHIFRLTRTKA